MSEKRCTPTRETLESNLLCRHNYFTSVISIKSTTSIPVNTLAGRDTDKASSGKVRNISVCYMSGRISSCLDFITNLLFASHLSAITFTASKAIQSRLLVRFVYSCSFILLLLLFMIWSY